VLSPRPFFSYSHDSPRHCAEVLGLSERLRRDGITTILDQYVNGSPAGGWPRWMRDSLNEATHVLCICTQRYGDFFEGRGEPEEGKGVDWEGLLAVQMLYDARSRLHQFLPVVLRKADERHIPLALRPHSRYVLDSEPSYQTLCDALLGKAGVEPGIVGAPGTRQRRRGTPLRFGCRDAPAAVKAAHSDGLLHLQSDLPPPEFRAERPPTGPNLFVGRKVELEMLDSWAAAENPESVLLFEGMSGCGATRLVWHWFMQSASTMRQDWAGRFWYSFRYGGRGMADFCRRALAYITATSPQEFLRSTTPELAERLLTQLRKKPWLLVLDGLEQLLVGCHHTEPDLLPEEAIGNPTDTIASRNPFDAIHPEDDALLRNFAGADPSKVLVTTSMMPRALLNTTGALIPRVRRHPLRGLETPDAEALLRSCGVRGEPAAIRRFLRRHCQGHPAVARIIAGLVRHYGPDPGNFDAWASDVIAGAGLLKLARPNLVQKRSHFLSASLEALSPQARQLLSKLALFGRRADPEFLEAFNPYRSPRLEDTITPIHPLRSPRPESTQARARKELSFSQYQTAVRRNEEYTTGVRSLQTSRSDATRRLMDTVMDLANRGLLQFDSIAGGCEIPPIVRRAAIGALQSREITQLGQQVLEYLAQRTSVPCEHVQTVDEVQDRLAAVRILLRMGRCQEACDLYRGSLGDALRINLEAHVEMLAVLRQFFPQGWTLPSVAIDDRSRDYLLCNVVLSLSVIGEHTTERAVLEAFLRHSIEKGNRTGMTGTKS
jgi:hypothetical protein